MEGAIRILERSSALTLSNGDQARVHVRLLATPERIKRELTGEANAELGLLRALWRGVGPALSTGAVVDLDGLPPGLGGHNSCAPLLDALQDRQFLAWERLGSGLYLTDKSAALSKFRIDWSVIDRRRQPSCRSFKRFRNTLTPRSAGVALCSATSAIPLRGRAAPVVTTAWGLPP